MAGAASTLDSAVMDQIEISVNGVWIPVPALHCQRDTVVISGSRIKLAEVMDEAWLMDEVADPELCLKRLRELGGKRPDIFTFTQKPLATVPKYAYYQEPESNAVVQFESFKQWWEGLPQETRKNVRRAEKRGVVVVEKPFDDALVAELVELNNSSPLRQRRKYRHYGKPFEMVKKDYCSFADRSAFLCAYVEGELIGFVKVVYRGDTASVLNLCTKENHSDKRPANILLTKAVEACAAKGLHSLSYGLFNYGKRRNTPLSTFKHRHGFEEVLTPRYYIALTLRGKLWMKLGFHRGVLGIVPNEWMEKIVSARTKWYSLTSSNKPV